MSIRIVKITSIIFILFLSLILCFGLFLSTKKINPVLMYHFIIENAELAKKDRLIVTVKTFERQMRFLKINNYNVISLEEHARYLKEKKKIPKNTLVITFDDGHLNNYENAYPVLKKYGLPATIFVIANYVSKSGYVKEEHIREMSSSGLITFGSHTLTHKHLPSVTDENELKKEIYDSKKKLEAILNKPVNCFSYPVGGFNKKIRDMVIDAGYTVAVSTSPGLYYPNDDPFAIKRVRISESSKNLFVFWFETSGLYKYLLELRKNSESQNEKKYE